ncbi:CASTOR/POLLUX-related putative ion channel [Rhodohalobacter halophilus]|uniref:CASTOR/POLLUX-related putative ion channel n=1 Tax=Rhodohalobacter halophilus TaxID=1812810 RepID=UPI00083F9B62|nr:hypothetical protein [Rhodohalobacter halophilus]
MVNKIKRRIVERFNFFLERQFIKGTHVQLLFVIALIGVLSIVGGLMVMPVDEPSNSPGDTLWWAFLRLTDPGYLGDDEGTWMRIVSTFLTIAGNVVFIGSLVAIITTWLNRKIRSLEQGLTKVSARNHIIILGWTNRTVHIAAELFQSSKRVKKFLKRHGARALKLIVLSDDVSPARLQELKDHPRLGKRAGEIILRSGESIDREHLQRVDSRHASAIIIPSPSIAGKELITPDVETIKTLLSLNAEMDSQNGIDTKPYVVAEILDQNKVKAAQRAYSGPLEVIPSDAILSRLIAQNIHHNGLSAVFNEMLSHSQNNNLYILDLPDADGNTLIQLKQAFSKAIILGILREENGELIPFLNPDFNMVFRKSDKLVVLARKLKDVDITAGSISKKSVAGIPENKKKRPRTGKYNGLSNILVLGWNHHIPALIKELGTYTRETFQLTLASVRPLESRKKEIDYILKETKNVECRHEFLDYIRESEMRSLNPHKYDHILMVSSDRLLAGEEADARTIVGYTLLEEILKSAEKRPQIVMELVDPGNELLIRNFRSESIISPLILSNLLATIAMRRELHVVYNELFTVNGAEIILRNLDDYELNPGLMTFEDLENHIAEYQDTALGLYCNTGDGKIDLQLNPSRTEKLNLQNQDRLVVLSTIDSDEGDGN